MLSVDSAGLLAKEAATPKPAQPRADRLVVSKPIVYEFYTKWCQPCRSFTPLLLSVLAHYKGSVDWAILDSEDSANAALVKRFSIQAWPTTVFVNSDGHITGRCQGTMSRTDLEKRMAILLTK